MKRAGLGKTEGRPEQLKLDEKPRLESPASGMRRLRERLADIEDLMERCDARNARKPEVQYCDGCDDHRNSCCRREQARVLM